MKISGTTSLLITVVIIAACSTVKKSTTSTASPAPASTTTTTANPSTDSYFFIKPADGIRPPGNEELSAIQIQYKDVTLEKLNEGYAIYTTGACVGCHSALNIYQYGEKQWETIIEDMAFRANISDAQKDAVYKYILAIKATQPK